MSLRTGLILRLCLVTLAIICAAVIYTVTETYRTARAETRATLVRASAVVERNYSMIPDKPGGPHQARLSLDVLQVAAPGICVEFERHVVTYRTVCADWQVFGEIPPQWFRAALKALFGPLEAIEHHGFRNRSDAYYVRVSFDPVAAATRAWQQMTGAVVQALAIGLGTVLLGAGVILHSVQPVRPIVAAIAQLADGRLDTRVEPRGSSEFRRIGNALNELAERLDHSKAERRSLRRKLIEVEDVERRQLARDLHDEFGQTLTATAALAASIEVTSGRERPDIAEDARTIGRNIRSMMATLRGAFARLRPPDLDEVGLEASVRQMIAGWSGRDGRGPRFELDYTLAPNGMPPDRALNLYRIVQEGVTNAVRHGTPETVRIALSETSDGANLLEIEDDGGGEIVAGETDSGYGILGIRERVAAMGGRLTATNTGKGVRLGVIVPPARAEHAA